MHNKKIKEEDEIVFEATGELVDKILSKYEPKGIMERLKTKDWKG